MKDFPLNDMAPFKDLIINQEDWLVKRLVHYAFERNYAEGTATIEEAWRNCVAGLSGAILQSVDALYPDYEFGPDHDFRNDPLCAFIVDTAKRHRERGVSLQMFHGLMVYYKEAWLDLVWNSEFAADYKNICLKIITRMFDRFIIALCAEWVENDQSRLIAELQIRNREAIVEKNRFLTIFESVPNPLFFVDDRKQIVNYNLAAAVMLNVLNHGSQYYYPSMKKESVKHADRDNSSHIVIGQPFTNFFPWLADDLDAFTTSSLSSVDLEKEVPDEKVIKYFNVKLSRRFDVSKTFVGGVVVLEDITNKKQAEKELRQAKEAQREEAQRNETRLNSILKILQLNSDSVHEFLDYTLNEAIQLTGSKIGYILHYNEDKQEFIINTWSKGAMLECTMDYKPTVFYLNQTGIWGEVVRQRKPIIINDYQAPNPLKKGCPEGHVHIGRFMEIPVFSDNNIVAVIAVANKESDYDQTDILQLSLLMDSVWKSLNMKQINEELRLSRQENNDKQQKIARLKKIAAKSVGLGDIQCFSDTMYKIIDEAKKYHIDRSIPVLIQGETGTGKELVAKLIHYGDLDDAMDAPFIDVNCAAITPGLFESEIFGYEAGAFTGGLNKGQKGKFDLAQGGTLFLDEIAEIPIELQGKFLRVIEEKEYYRVGGLSKIKTDVRIICATNVDLAASVNKGTFRKDLFYRLSVGFINIPPLRERPEAILPLASFFLSNSSRSRRKNFTRISAQAGQILKTYDWPGNVRELKNIIDSIVFMHDDSEIKPLHLDKIMEHTLLSSDRLSRDRKEQSITSISGSISQVGSFTVSMTDDGFNLNDVVRDIIKKALILNKGNKAETSRFLGISRATLYKQLKNQD